MKKRNILLLSFLGIWLACTAADNAWANARPWESLSQNLNIINVSHVTESDVNEMMSGGRPEMAVEFSAQTLLPLSYFLKGNLVHLVEAQESSQTIEVVRTFYVRYVNGELILSTNLTDWRPLLEFITGNASVCFQIHDGKPSLVVGGEINQHCSKE